MVCYSLITKENFIFITTLRPGFNTNNYDSYEEENYMKPKIEDVAKLAGVSKTTVSRVLNNRGYLSQKTIDKVNEAIKELDYRPNVVARQLFKQKTKLIGLIFPTTDNPFFGQLVAGLETKLFNYGFKVLLCNSYGDSIKEEQYLKELLAHQVDGLIVGSHNADIKAYQQPHLPIVAVDTYINDDIPIVTSDNYAGGRLATQLLIDDGAKKIIHTNDKISTHGPFQLRRQGYKDVMKEAGLKPKIYTIEFTTDYNKRVASIKKIFTENPDIDGLFVSNDMDAAQVIDVAKNFGYRIPEDLKIVGYDGTNTSRVLIPDLTTIIQPIDQIVEAAVYTLMGRINNYNVSSNTTFPVLLRRGKTA